MIKRLLIIKIGEALQAPDLVSIARKLNEIIEVLNELTAAKERQEDDGK